MVSPPRRTRHNLYLDTEHTAMLRELQRQTGISQSALARIAIAFMASNSALFFPQNHVRIMVHGTMPGAKQEAKA